MKTAAKEKGYQMVDDIKPTAVLSRAYSAPFDEGKKLLESEGYHIISLEENAGFRMQEGKEAFVSRNGNWVKEGVLYIPNKGNKLVRNSPILYSAVEAVQAHREGKEFYPSKEAIEKALEDSINFSITNTEIPTNRFGENELTVWAFGLGDSKKAQAYGDFLKESGISKMPAWSIDKNYVNEQSNPFARQLWFDWLGGRSGLVGGGDLRCGSRVRGVS
jgi:hypothetical protein